MSCRPSTRSSCTRSSPSRPFATSTPPTASSRRRWSPLGGVNRYSPADADAVKNPLEHPTIVERAASYQKTPAQVVLRWHIEHGVSATPKSVKPQRVAENIDLFDFALAPDEVTAIDALDTGVRGGPDPELVDTKLYPF